MDYIIAVFSVRTDTIQFSKILQQNKINCSVIETPKFASSSCGISVKFMVKDFAAAKNLLTKNGKRSFVRFYLVNGAFGGTRVTPLKF